MNNTHQELIAEKVAEFNKQVDDDYYEITELTDITQLKSTLWTEDYWPESQVELSVDKVRAFLTQILQATIDTVLEEKGSYADGYIQGKFDAQMDNELDNTPPNKV